jgi:putative nucleotidyltransferase with HDIG domain
MTTARQSLSDAGHLYVGLIAAVGSGIVLHSLYALATQGIGYQWFVLAGLTLLSGSFTIRIPTIPARLSVSETFVFAAAILFGPAAATVIVVLDSLIISLWLRRTSRHFMRVMFNMAAPAIAIWTSSHLFFQIAAIQPLYLAPRPILSLVVPLLVLALLYFLLNSWLIAGAVGFEKRISPFVVWRDNFLWLSLNFFSGASVAALLLPYLQDEQRPFVRVAGILLPLLLISYLTFKTALGRVEDANKHLSELNRLYLSTIETLAMAIDAKDQITHGHIRRVQQYAVNLAKRVGISDQAQIRAIEAASLLHDMGKLAVPEYILNKPGKLTPAEFEKMKLHASVGADILSAIDFPYPVVPIVRHHHENWDGTGYPDGLKGSDIPIGARILSVVDCFDALTSDRPYRPRLPDSEAIKILLDRRGSMYDPLVVDTFISVHQEIAPAPDSAESASHGLSAIARDFHPWRSEAGAGLDDIAASTEEMLVLFDLARNLSIGLSVFDAADILGKHIRRLIPVSTCVTYIYDALADELVVAHATGEHAGQFNGLRIPRGLRLTGWVAANRQTIINSDPVLDLGEMARRLRPRLTSCLSTPFVHNNMAIGVLTLYSVQRDAFSENHARIAEVISRQVAPTLMQAITNDPATRSLAQGHRSSAPRSSGPLPGDATNHTYSPGFSIAFLRFADSHGQVNRAPEEELVTEAARALRSVLRDTDLLFRYSPTEVVVLLGHTPSDQASQIAHRIAERLREQKRISPDRAPSSFTIGVATAPSDGGQMDNLIAAAKRRSQGLEDTGPSPESVH